MLFSFNTVDNADFKSFVQTMIVVGAKYGNISADNVLYGRKTGREKNTADVQATIVSRMHEAAKVGAVSIVTDMRSDDVVQNNYLKITFFWVSDNNDKWSLKHGMHECK